MVDKINLVTVNTILCQIFNFGILIFALRFIAGLSRWRSTFVSGRCRHYLHLFPLLVNFLSKFVDIFVVLYFGINQLDFSQVLMRFPATEYKNLILYIMFILLSQVVHWVHCKAALFIELTALDHLPPIWVLKIQTLNSIDRVAIYLTALHCFESLEDIEVSAVFCDECAWVTSLKI